MILFVPSQIGHHFSKWGRVVDVVMVKDFGSLLNLAATATSLEQQRKAAENKVVSGRRAGEIAHTGSFVRSMRVRLVMVPAGVLTGGNCQTCSHGAVLCASLSVSLLLLCVHSRQAAKDQKDGAQDGVVHAASQPAAGLVGV